MCESRANLHGWPAVCAHRPPHRPQIPLWLIKSSSPQEVCLDRGARLVLLCLGSSPYKRTTRNCDQRSAGAQKHGQLLATGSVNSMMPSDLCSWHQLLEDSIGVRLVHKKEPARNTRRTRCGRVRKLDWFRRRHDAGCVHIVSGFCVLETSWVGTRPNWQHKGRARSRCLERAKSRTSVAPKPR